jgi:hypothetical protein
LSTWTDASWHAVILGKRPNDELTEILIRNTILGLVNPLSPKFGKQPTNIPWTAQPLQRSRLYSTRHEPSPAGPVITLARGLAQEHAPAQETSSRYGKASLRDSPAPGICLTWHTQILRSCLEGTAESHHGLPRQYGSHPPRRPTDAAHRSARALPRHHPRHPSSPVSHHVSSHGPHAQELE